MSQERREAFTPYQLKIFLICDMKEKGQLSIRYCPNDKLVADCIEIPLHGSKFKEFRQMIMNLSTSTTGQVTYGE